ncbi:hypothetical protein F0562_015341 [Nyssa sinensis]|uniref:Uncharacterized protein n=1 Tax=Nyssa sinensis TaxID=561372 RepID=A0A5J4ZH50_9ASTE|nr:hypothetical protein F0562_015341 [Nyssa sinensis]
MFGKEESSSCYASTAAAAHNSREREQCSATGKFVDPVGQYARLIGEFNSGVVETNVLDSSRSDEPGIMQLVAGCLLNLKILNLKCCNSITDVAISAIEDSCRKLLCLKLGLCTNMLDKGLVWIASNCTRFVN